MDMRDVFFSSILELVRADSDLLVLTADHGALGLDQLKLEFPQQYINVGIAEQNLISMAAGLALSGKKIIVYAIVPFITLRCLEQINIDICSMNLPITIVGVGAGFAYSIDGPTHHGLSDQAIMSMCPNLSIYNLSDPIMTTGLTSYVIKQNKPSYIRIEKGVVPQFYLDQYCDYSAGIAEIVFGKDLLIVSTGYMMHRLYALLMQDFDLSAQQIGVIDVYCVKPFNKEIFINIARHYHRILCIEENYFHGGLGMLIATVVNQNQLPIAVNTISVPERFYFNYGKREDLHGIAGLDPVTLKTAIKQQLADCCIEVVNHVY